MLSKYIKEEQNLNFVKEEDEIVLFHKDNQGNEEQFTKLRWELSQEKNNDF